MELKINDKTYPLRLSIKGVNALDNIYKLEVEGIAFGMGLNSLATQLRMGNVTGLINFYKACTYHLAQKPTDEELEAYIGEMTEASYKKAFKEAEDFLSKAPLSRHQIKALDKAVEEAKEKKKEA